MEWTREKTLALISEYRKRRELWDMTHEDYRKKEMKQRFLLEVSKNLGGISILEIEKKFHTLRTQYHREINRMKRKESYNSKWFGFKQLQFLSSPKACRSGKGRIKSEITEDGTVTKYIISENIQDNSGVSVNSSNSTIPDEFLIHRRKPSNITYDQNSSGVTAQASSAATSRSQELEKLIEETTKDVDYIEDAKPKLTIKEIRTPMDTQSYETADTEIEAHAEEQLQEHEQQQEQQHEHQHQQHTQQEQQTISAENVDPLAIEIQGDGEIINHYHQSGTAQATTIHNLPRIIKIQRRDTIAGHEEHEYYHHQHQHQTQQQEQHIHGLPQGAKRIYYGTTGQHTATIIAPTTPPSHQSTNGNSLMPNVAHHRGSLMPSSQSPTSSAGQQQVQTRDEYTTYGEYVANEMRNLSNREVLVALKHKINTALFEASMSELQK